MAYRAPTSTASTVSTSNRTTAPGAQTVTISRQQRSQSAAPRVVMSLRTSSTASHLPEQNVRNRLQLVYRYWDAIKEAVYAGGWVLPRSAVAEQLRSLEGMILAEPGFTGTAESLQKLEQILRQQNALKGEAGLTIEANLSALRHCVSGLAFLLPEQALEFARGEGAARATGTNEKPARGSEEAPILALSWHMFINAFEPDQALRIPGVKSLMRDVELQIACEKPDERTLTCLCDRMANLLPKGDSGRQVRTELAVFAQVVKRLPHRIPTPMRFQITSRSSTNQSTKPRTRSSPARVDPRSVRAERPGMQAVLERRENLKAPPPAFNLHLEKDEDGSL